VDARRHFRPYSGAMARLRVGDIEIDGTNVTINGVPQAPVSASGGVSVSITMTPARTVATRPDAPTTALATTTPASPPTGLDAFADLPVGDAVLFGGGALLLVITFFVFAVTGAGAWGLFAGVGAIVAGVVRRRAIAARAVRRERERELELRGHVDKLRALLAAQNQDQTIEWIVAKSGLPEPTVVRTLALMRARQEVSEDLNVDTGEWFYVAARALPPGTRDLDDRLAVLEEEERKR
jgi:hypothetical protein